MSTKKTEAAVAAPAKIPRKVSIRYEGPQPSQCPVGIAVSAAADAPDLVKQQAADGIIARGATVIVPGAFAYQRMAARRDAEAAAKKAGVKAPGSLHLWVMTDAAEAKAFDAWYAAHIAAEAEATE